MQNSDFDIAEIIEGTTKLLVPRESITEKVPPKEPAFFNPRAKLNRDFSIIVYSAFLKNFDGPKIFLEGLSGLGARGLRVSNEIKSVEKVVINDLNPSALEIAKRSARLNELKNVDFSENEICRFLSDYSKKGNRGTIVDIDPFGSPSRYIDCGIRATMHGGMLSVTATDLQVLHGLFKNACKRRYGGTPIKVEYGNEIAIRLILGCIRSVAARLDIEFIPLFVESDMHYYRVYLKILNRPDQEENLGYIIHCKNCGKREIGLEEKINCESCGEKNHHAGPLWIGKMFDKKFLKEMLDETKNLQVDKTCERLLQKCILEEDMPGTYYTLDEIASRLKTSPIRLEKIIEKLHQSGFKASQTCLNPTGFRTDADIEKIKEFF